MLHTYLSCAQKEDIESVLQIEDRSFPTGIREAKDVFLERIATFPTGFLLLKTSEYPDPIGYISSEIWPFKPNVETRNLRLGHSVKETHDPDGEELYISSIALLPDFRGNGLGKLMVEYLLTNIRHEFPRLRSSILIVSEKWPAAQKTYMKMGFKEIFIIPSFFIPIGFSAENGIVMRKIF